MQFFSLKMNVTPAIDPAHPDSLVQDYVTLVEILVGSNYQQLQQLIVTESYTYGYTECHSLCYKFATLLQASLGREVNLKTDSLSHIVKIFEQLY